MESIVHGVIECTSTGVVCINSVCCADCTTVGVPEISPVEAEKVRPAGSAGVISHEVTVPPLADGDAGVIQIPSRE